MDHISDSFLETNVPLLVLIEAAKSGNEKEVKEYAQVFREHANKLVEVSHKLYMERTHIYSIYSYSPGEDCSIMHICNTWKNIQTLHIRIM